MALWLSMLFLQLLSLNVFYQEHMPHKHHIFLNIWQAIYSFLLTQQFQAFKIYMSKPLCHNHDKSSTHAFKASLSASLRGRGTYTTFALNASSTHVPDLAQSLLSVKQHMSP